MKKLLIIVLLALSFSSCKKLGVDPLKTCEQATEDFTTALFTFALSQTQKNCENYIDATKSYLKSCANLTATERKEVEKDLDNTDCKNL
jgi:hypothetical protein